MRMLFKTTIKTVGLKITSVVKADNQSDAANKAAVGFFGGVALFVTTTDQPICGWVGLVYRLPIDNGKLEERAIIKVIKMKKIEQAATVGYVGKKFFDTEMREDGTTPTKESRIEYRLKEATWLRNIVFNNLREIYIRRWFDSTYGNSYYSLRLIAYADNTKYGMNIHMRYGYGDSHSLLRQSGIAPIDCLVHEWLEHNGIIVVDEGYGLKADMYKSAI